ncbi:MAG TPA: coproporphyrinogen-III oxidase family protein, partial [Kofleriaceae bacterium]|nr:coproporphyrinogen-III oxidase family protein [Kofleriaceae bacterium]
MADLGVYIHYPWCRSRCPYCDFPIAVAPLDQIPHQGYLDAIRAELEVHRAAFVGRTLVSIYFGGGTPSLWPAGCLAGAAAAVCAAFGGDALREVTIEANPVDCTPDNLAAWRAAGIDRVSIGVQSLAAGDLVALGRDHRMGEGLAALDAARAAGFARMSADIILGAPGSRQPLASVVELARRGVPHLSVYELTVEEGTPLHQQVARGEVVPESEDQLAELYLGAHECLTAGGYEHYEVSSYARPGARAVHNSLYWRGAEFLGLGAGAASFRRAAGAGGGVRWSNHRSVGRYLAAAPDARRAEVDELDAAALAADRIWLGLRTSDGVPLDAVPAALLDWLAGPAGLASVDGDRVRPTV